MSTINSKPFGEVEISEKQIFNFPKGILGFENLRKFAILDSDENSPFKWLQSLEEDSLAFIIIQPELFMGNYNLMITDGDLEDIDCKNVEDVIVFAIVTIPENPNNMTANLQGPIIINSKNSVAKQAISLDESYQVKHRILDEMNKQGGE